MFSFLNLTQLTPAVYLLFVHSGSGIESLALAILHIVILTSSHSLWKNEHFAASWIKPRLELSSFVEIPIDDN